MIKRLLLTLFVVALSMGISYGSGLQQFYIVSQGTCHTIAPSTVWTSEIPVQYTSGICGYNFTATSFTNSTNMADNFTLSNTQFGYQESNIDGYGTFTASTSTSWTYTDPTTNIVGGVAFITNVTGTTSQGTIPFGGSFHPYPNNNIRLIFNNASATQGMSVCTFIVTVQ